MTTQIKFSDGSSIQWVNKETLRYSDSGHTALIWVDFEPGFFTGGRVIKASSIESPSNESNDISDEIKTQIVSKVTKYYDKYKVKYRIEQ